MSNMPMFSRRRLPGRAAADVKCIRLQLLEAVMEAAKSSLPNEFAAGLRASGDTIYELTIIPGTKSNFHSANFNYHGILGDFSTVGTVHSHPSGNRMPSVPDLRLFSSVGRLHIIVGYPFGVTNWTAYDKKGQPFSLRVV